MAKGSKKLKRPRDVVSNAKRVAMISTGEIEETEVDDGKNKAAQELGSKGGKARAAKMTAKRRSEIAKNAALKRWSKN